MWVALSVVRGYGRCVPGADAEDALWTTADGANRSDPESDAPSAQRLFRALGLLLYWTYKGKLNIVLVSHSHWRGPTLSEQLCLALNFCFNSAIQSKPQDKFPQRLSALPRGYPSGDNLQHLVPPFQHVWLPCTGNLRHWNGQSLKFRTGLGLIVEESLVSRSVLMSPLPDMCQLDLPFVCL